MRECLKGAFGVALVFEIIAYGESAHFRENKFKFILLSLNRRIRVLRVHSGFSDFGTPKNPSFKHTLSATYLLKCKIPNYSLRSSTRPNCLTANLLTLASLKLLSFGIIKASLSLLSLFKLLASLVIFGCTSAKQVNFFALGLHKNS